MPIYEYQCTGCHQQFDLIQKMSDEPIKQCPECLQETVVRLISAPNFQLKGSGWYATDFKNQGTDQKKTDSSSQSTNNSEKSVTDVKKPVEKSTTEKN